MASETRFKLSRPSSLARRSLISTSANSLRVLLHHVSAVVRSLSHPRRARHVRAQEPLVHLLLVAARKPRAGRDILDRAVAVADREPTLSKLDHLGHVPVLGREPGQLVDPRLKV